MSGATASLLPPVVRDERGLAFAAAADLALDADKWQACPANARHAPDEVLWELARQYDVAGPLYRAMRTRGQRERLVGVAWSLQRRRGTRWAVAEVMRLLGYTGAEVLDRTGLLLYDGEAIHDGTHFFDAGLSDWREYRIRLLMGPGGRSFAGADMRQAAALAVAWAPLRSRLVGWNARHVLASSAPSPENTAAMVSAIVLAGPADAREVGYWTQIRPDGSVVNRWRVEAGNVGLPVVTAVSVRLIDGSEPYRWGPPDLPAVEMLPGMHYEGEWTLRP